MTEFRREVCVVIDEEPAPGVPGVLSQDFDAIELRTIGWQKVQIQALFGPLPPLLVNRGTLVYAGVIDQYDSWHLVRLSRNLVKERNHIIPCRRALLSSLGQQAVVAQCPEHVHALPVPEQFDGSTVRRFESGRFSPSVSHWRIRTEARSIEIQ